jgi:hypothetical protein
MGCASSGQVVEAQDPPVGKQTTLAPIKQAPITDKDGPTPVDLAFPIEKARTEEVVKQEEYGGTAAAAAPLTEIHQHWREDTDTKVLPLLSVSTCWAVCCLPGCVCASEYPNEYLGAVTVEQVR